MSTSTENGAVELAVTSQPDEKKISVGSKTDPDGVAPSQPEGETTGGQVQRDTSLKTKSVLKQGHLRVKEDGQKVYKKTPSQAIMAATQLGIGFSVGRLSAKPERDVLMVDFYYVEKVWFPSSGSKETPSHKYTDFRFKSYAPVAFRFFRDIFKIQPSDFLISLANEPIKEISNPGASGSLFFVSNDDMFIVKTVQHKEATFLQQLLPGYYMNLHQNPRTLLPKFFGLYCYQAGTSNIRLTVMNNLLPSKYKCHMKFDLKGSTYKRKANKSERSKKSPTYKDLDFINMFPTGILLDSETYDAVIKTISRDVRVLESFNIMDYSFLLGIHNIDESEREKQENMVSPSLSGTNSNPEREARRNEFVAALEAIQISKDAEEDDGRPHGGVLAKNDKGERLILFMGIIDILQSYRLAKKMEHSWKSLLTDGDTVSVHKPSYYAKRFLDFIKDTVFTRVAVQRGQSKRRSVKVPPSMQITPKAEGAVSSYNSENTTEEDNKEKSKGKVVTIVEPGEKVNLKINPTENDKLKTDSERDNNEEVSHTDVTIEISRKESGTVHVEHSQDVTKERHDEKVVILPLESSSVEDSQL